jgi:tetratricopeptide (TPR) repeat protein
MNLRVLARSAPGRIFAEGTPRSTQALSVYGHARVGVSRDKTLLGMVFLERLAPYLTVVNTVLAIGVLTFLIHLFNLLRGAFADQIAALRAQKDLLDERLKGAEERVKFATERTTVADENAKRTEVWYERRIKEVNDKLAAELAQKNITVERLVDASQQPELSETVLVSVRELAVELRTLREGLGAIQGFTADAVDPETLINVGRAAYASQDWVAAGDSLETAATHYRTNWELWLLAAVARANSRVDDQSHLAAIRCMSAAIAHAPSDVDPNLRARMYGYRGAMFKRLRRLDEAENDLLLGRHWATAEYEQSDIAYNLAGVYSLKNDRERARQNVRLIIKSQAWRAVLASKPEFRWLSIDHEYREALSDSAGA